MEDENFEIYPSNKGGKKAIYKGYIYTVHKPRTCGGYRWRCTQRNLQCKGSMTTNSENKVAGVNMAHNHEPDMQSVQAAKIKYFVENSNLHQTYGKKHSRLLLLFFYNFKTNNFHLANIFTHP